MHEWAINAEQALCSAKACGREPGELNGGSSRRNNQNMTGGQFCAISLQPRIHRTIGGRRRIAALCLLDCTCHRWSAASGAISWWTPLVLSGHKNWSSFRAIANEAQPGSIRVIYCDTAVQGAEEFGPAEPIKLSPKGGGGTDFRLSSGWRRTASSRSA